MKPTKLFHLVVSVLVMFLSISGCRTAPPPAVTNKIDDLIRAAANQAARHADEAKAAQQLASELSDGSELRALLDQADEAAQKAQQYADEAASLQNQIDDLAARNQVADDVLKAQQAANEASHAVDAVILLRRFIYKSYVDQISSNIVDSSINVEDENTRELLKEVLNQAFCFTVAGALSGKFPALEAIQNDVQGRATSKGIGLTDPEWKISAAIAADADDLLTSLSDAQKQEDLEAYKDMCDDLLDLP